MVIETKLKEGGKTCLFDDLSITSIEQMISDDVVKIWTYGKSEAMIISMPFEEIKNIFIEAKKRDRFSDSPPQKIEIKKYPLVEIGEHKFMLITWRTEFEDGQGQQIKISANFPVKNDLIKQCVEEIKGVEKYCDYLFDKYEGSISVGKLFDIEAVKNKVEEKIIECIK